MPIHRCRAKRHRLRSVWKERKFNRLGSGWEVTNAVVSHNINQDRSKSSLLLAKPAPERGPDAVGMLYAFDQHIDPVATPEEFAVEYHCRYAKHAECFCFIDDEAVLFSRG